MDELGSNVVANIIAAVVLAILGWIFSLIIRLPFVHQKRKHLFEFFGITKDQSNLIAYLSTVFVRMGGSDDFKGVSRTFQGPAVPEAELQVIEPIVKLFSHPFLDSLPSGVRNWLGNISMSFRKISPIVNPSPRNRKEISSGNIFTVGSQYYNSATDLYTETCNHTLKMEQIDRDMVIRVNRGPRKNDIFRQRPDKADDLAIVEKLYDSSTESTVFFAAGLGSIGTVGAVYFIVDNWEKLHSDFGSGPFAICLRFQDVLEDPNASLKPIELSRFQI